MIFERFTLIVSSVLTATLLLGLGQSSLLAQETSGFTFELEVGPVWQSRNEVQIPNDQSGTRFSLVDIAGNGPWPSGRLYLTWDINDRHSLRGLLAPLAYTETGSINNPLNFAGESFLVGAPVEATYKFNSWRLGYRYRLVNSERLALAIGFTAKIRDAKIELSQGETTSKDTDIGFVPLLYLGTDWEFTRRWHLLVDFEGLAGGPGRAFDVALKLGHSIGDHWVLTAGYRTLEGGADVDAVYNFAWLHYALIAVSYRI